MKIETISNISQLIGTVTHCGRIRIWTHSTVRIEEAESNTVAGELMRTLMSAELADGITILRGSPDGVSADELRRAGPEAERAVVLICTTFEMMGLLVFGRIASFKWSLVVEPAGGIIVVMWHKLGRWLNEIRLEQSELSWADWFQWLAQQMRTSQES